MIYKGLHSVIIIWPHTQFGILLSSRDFFTKIKKSYPNIRITLMVDSLISKNIDLNQLYKLLEFDNNDRIVPKSIRNIVFGNFDIAIVPSVEKFNLFDHILMWLTRSKIRIGIKNGFSFLQTESVNQTLFNTSDIHISELLLNYLQPVLTIDQFNQIETAFKIPCKEKEKFINEYNFSLNQKLIVLNNEPEEIKNRWGLQNLLNSISRLNNSGNYFFFYIENQEEKDVQKMLEKEFNKLTFISKDSIQEVQNVLSISDLVITCNSNIMHLAGLIDVPQISIFGCDNPFNLAPIGRNKVFIKKPSELINDVTGDDVFEIAQKFLKEEK